MLDSSPYLGATVHYRVVQNGQRKCFAALVIDVSPDHQRVALQVFTPPGWAAPDPGQLVQVAHGVDGEAYCWHWRQECD